MFDAGRRPMGRHFYWLLAMAMIGSSARMAWGIPVPQNGTASTIVADAVAVTVPSRNAAFSAVVRSITIDVVDPANDRGMYTIEFANDLATPLALKDQLSATTVPLQDTPVRLSTVEAGAYYLANLTNAQITQVTSTTVQVDAGANPSSGQGIEVRTRDFGWGSANDRNLLGRFNSQTFSLPRLGRTQNYYLRLYDNSTPPRYSRYSGALHVDYPL